MVARIKEQPGIQNSRLCDFVYFSFILFFSILVALFLCPRSRRCVGTAEQNRASGQRGQRTRIPFAAGRDLGQVSSPSVSCSDRREKCSLRCFRGPQGGGGGREGNWELGRRDLGCL